MAVINGASGSVSFGAGTQYDNNVTAFTLNIADEALETTGFGATARTFIPSGIQSWSGTYTAYIDGTTAIGGTGTAAATLTLTATTSRTYTGSAIVTQIGVSETFDGIPTAVFSFQGTGALTIG